MPLQQQGTAAAGDGESLHCTPLESHLACSLAGPAVTPQKAKNRKHKWCGKSQVLSSGSDTQVGEDSPEVKRERHLRPRSLI